MKPAALNRRTAATALLLVAMAACQRDAAPVTETPASPAAAAGTDGIAAAPEPAATAAPGLVDVIETDPRYVVGISYPPAAAADPGLAKALHDYAEASRAELMQAVGGLDAAPTAPYELSLGFRELMRTADVVAVAADGSLYTGGAHGQPLVARFVWLPGEQRMLTSDSLLATPADWRPVADYIGEQLGAAAHTRAADEALDPADRQRLLSTALKMIDQGTEPQPQNFAQFEPVAAADGRIAALRFVFPPYQVGPYADGVQNVEVPAAVLRPHLAEGVRGLFVE
ncbi:DUF3298 and DUF4163 domain-containing protein [Pseudoxanthomonas daejeonensis]|uniref:DUF3298 and DUF4163 domain-containing protein n=1 Tax=Pseudoxanthomonas daejeonensis TaxID=266062 RepID=UPI001F53EC9C|nr:DUF3298 and DUF4163 domain-containing protein [Pseudoxanthomonas daejeonensis]UNK57450.1 DUF3298 and DUF4163 domain-containing protein [Pseudoxanthomonas daejeonensis]